MLRFLWLVPICSLLSAGCDDGSSIESGCLEPIEQPREACVSFDQTSRNCEPFLPIEFLPVDLAEFCECQLIGVADEFPDCEAAFEAERSCIGTLECEEYVALINGDESAPCRTEIEAANEVCVDENGLPVGN